MTDPQIAASRANGAKSHGPVTPAGKHNSSQNARRHGMLAQTVVLEGESQDRFRELLQTFTLQFNPRTPTETALIETMAVSRWRQMRIWGIQKAGFDLEMARSQHPQAPPPVRAAMVFRHMADTSRVLDLALRYEIACDRQFSRALALLLKLRAQPQDADLPALPPAPNGLTWNFPDEPVTPLKTDYPPGPDVEHPPGPAVPDRRESQSPNPCRLHQYVQTPGAEHPASTHALAPRRASVRAPGRDRHLSTPLITSISKNELTPGGPGNILRNQRLAECGFHRRANDDERRGT